MAERTAKMATGSTNCLTRALATTNLLFIPVSRHVAGLYHCAELTNHRNAGTNERQSPGAGETSSGNSSTGIAENLSLDRPIPHIRGRNEPSSETTSTRRRSGGRQDRQG